MKYLRLFNEHSGYTEAMQTLEAPNVSHCVGENHVHYKPELPSVLPGNEEVWELYSSLVCDDERLEQDLKNIFSKYAVTSEEYSYTAESGGHHPDPMYTDYGYSFVYGKNPSSDNWFECDIFTSRTANYGFESTAMDSVTNDCGEEVLPGEYGVGEWRERTNLIVGPIGPVIS